MTVTNVAPTATFEAPAATLAGSPFTIALTSPFDPSSADTAAGFTYTFSCGDGTGFSAFQRLVVAVMLHDGDRNADRPAGRSGQARAGDELTARRAGRGAGGRPAPLRPRQTRGSQ